jgi:hypothetical protein
MAEGSDSTGLLDAAKQELKDASRFLFFNEAGTVLAASFAVSCLRAAGVCSCLACSNCKEPCSLQVDARELKPLAATIGDRDEAITNGMTVEGIRFEVGRVVLRRHDSSQLLVRLPCTNICW